VYVAPRRQLGTHQPHESRQPNWRDLKILEHGNKFRLGSFLIFFKKAEIQKNQGYPREVPGENRVGLRKL
jgi:hypothetical protein